MMSRVPAVLEKLLSQEGHCASAEEASGIAELMIDGLQQAQSRPVELSATRYNSTDFPADEILQVLQDCLDLSPEQCTRFIQKLHAELGIADSESDSSNHSESDSNDDDDGNTDYGMDDGQVIEDGECILCERSIMLTRHHLIPKETWSRIIPKLLHAARALEDGGGGTPGDVDNVKNSDHGRAQTILGDGLAHWIPKLLSYHERHLKQQQKAKAKTLPSLSSTIKKSSLKLMLQHNTIDICRLCHSQIHRTHDNMALALEYNTVESLLGDESILKYCKWANKQRAGKYSVRR